MKAKTKEELFEKTEFASRYLEVYDMDGKPVMRKDIYFQDMNKMF